MTLLAQLPYPASQHGLHYPQRSAGFHMAVPLIQYQRSRITFEFSCNRTSLLAHQTPLRQSLSPIGVSGFIRPLQVAALIAPTTINPDSSSVQDAGMGMGGRSLRRVPFVPKIWPLSLMSTALSKNPNVRKAGGGPGGERTGEP